MDAETFHSATDKRCKTSALEQEILTKLGELGLDLVPQVKRRSWVFDAGVQGTRILIEVNGAYWHSLPHAQARDERKAQWAAQHGYTIITVAEEAYQADPDGMLLQVLEQVELARATAVDRVDTERPISSYTFDDWRDDFVQSLAEFGNVRQACIAAGVSRAGAYKRRETDAEFAQAWDEALDNFCDLLEGVYARRAIEQSDRALEFLLKANRPEKYADKSKLELTGKDGGPVAITTPALEQAAQELSEWRKQRMSELSSLPSAAPTSPTSATPTE
jgi:very-short-patch-repair endonuclease